MDYYDIQVFKKKKKMLMTQELKTAFKKKAMQYRPDKGGDPKSPKQINEAYPIIDPVKRPNV